MDWINVNPIRKPRDLINFFIGLVIGICYIDWNKSRSDQNKLAILWNKLIPITNRN